MDGLAPCKAGDQGINEDVAVPLCLAPVLIVRIGMRIYRDKEG